MVDLKTLSERILVRITCLKTGQINADSSVKLVRIHRSFSGGWNGHFEPDRSLSLQRRFQENNPLVSIEVAVASLPVIYDDLQEYA
jgi:hypothetical protein